jgi:hypothetical protein
MSDKQIEEFKCSVAFFTSSQDEFLELDGWEGFGWKDQYQAFSEFAKRVRGRKVLRIHPNFVNKSFGHSLSELRRVIWLLNSHIEIVPVCPTDKINSYELLELAERVFVYGSTVGLEASAFSKCVWNSMSSVYDVHADIRNFRPLDNHTSSFFEPWPVDSSRSLEIIQTMIDSDVQYSEGVVPPDWSPSAVPLSLRAYNLLLIGSISYLLTLIQKSLSTAVNKALIRAVSKLFESRRRVQVRKFDPNSLSQ